MRNNVVGRFEPLDDLKAAWLLHEHTLARIVRVADSDHKPIRHLPNELALVKRDRHKLAAPRIQAFAEEVQPSLFITLESPFVHLLTQGLHRRCLALEPPFRICFHNSSPPCSSETTNPANRRYTVKPAARPNMARSSVLPKATPRTQRVQGPTLFRRAALLIAESVARREKLPLPWDPLQFVEAAVVERNAGAGDEVADGLRDKHLTRPWCCASRSRQARSPRRRALEPGEMRRSVREPDRAVRTQRLVAEKVAARRN